jgi:hypothetical protein
MRRSVLIATPSLDGERVEQAKLAVQCGMLECSGLGWDGEAHIHARDSLICQARNILLGKFIASNHTDMVWLDADVGFGPGALTRIMHHNVDFVAVPPRLKSEPEAYPVRWMPDGGQWVDPATGLRKADAVPFGFVRITRSCAERMVEAYRDKWFMVGYCSHKNWCVFDTDFRDHQYWGEDFVFCQRWRALGGDVWVDAEIPTTHVDVGNKHIYSGHLGNWLRANRPKPHAVDEVAATIDSDGAAALAKARAMLGGQRPMGDESNAPPVPKFVLGPEYARLFADALGDAP